MAETSAIDNKVPKQFFRLPSILGGASAYKKALFEGLIAGFVICLLLIIWLHLRADDTAEKIQPLIPYKVTTIELPPELQSTTESSPAQTTPVQEGLNGTRNINSLEPAPLEGLTENVDGQFLPLTRIGADGDLTPFEAYKKPFEIVAGRPLVAIVVVDFGISETFSQSVLDILPTEVSLVLNSYAQEPSKWAAAARAFGHEFWLQLPMQTLNLAENDSGPNAILLNAPEQANQERLFDVLATSLGYAGVVSQKNHAFVADDVDAGPVMKQILGRGLAFAESNPEIPAYGLSIAMEQGNPYAQNNFWIDEDLRPESIERALQEMELQAMKKGKAIAFVRPYPVAIKKVDEWIKAAADKGIQVAPLSAMVQ